MSQQEEHLISESESEDILYETESDEEINLIMDSDEDEDEEDEAEEDLINFPGFEQIFILFKNNDEIQFLTFEEKQIIFNYLNNAPFISHNTFTIVKEHILKIRSFQHPSINIFNIRKILNKNIRVNCQHVKTTLYNHIINNEVVTPEEQKSLALNYYSENNYVTLYDNAYNQTSELLKFPDEILEKILLFSIPSHDLNMDAFFNIRKTCKRFHRIIYSKIFCRKVINTFELKNSIEDKFTNIEAVNHKLYINIIYEFITNVFKNFLGRIIGLQLIKSVGGFKKFFEIPYIEHCIRADCLDNLCGSCCGFRYHYIFDIAKGPISRGIDSNGRFYLLFIYKTENDIFYEFVYNNEIPEELNVTFSGFGINTFIGNKSINYTETHSAMYRTLRNKSYDYIERLINDDCGEVYYKNKLDYAVEDKTKKVSLFFDKNKMRNYLIKKYNHLIYEHEYFKQAVNEKEDTEDIPISVLPPINEDEEHVDSEDEYL